MITQSESVKQIAVALSKVLCDISNPKKDALNPYFKSSYLKLPTLLVLARTILPDHDLAFSQVVEVHEGKTYMCTVLLHKSGEWLKSYYPMVCKDLSDPQKLGSASTYARRYGLQALLGVVGDDEDDDGNKASKEKKIDTETLKKMRHYLNGHDDVLKLLLKSCGVGRLEDIKESQIVAARDLVMKHIKDKSEEC